MSVEHEALSAVDAGGVSEGPKDGRDTRLAPEQRGDGRKAPSSRPGAIPGQALPDARIPLVTLGVADLARAARFYEAMGWHRTDAGNDSVVFLEGEGIVLSLFGAASLAEDAGLPLEPIPAFRGVALAINMPGEAEVERLFAQALAAGASPVKPPHKVFWGGYSGYFADPDGHLWEIAHNPFFPLDAAGRIDLAAAPEEPA